MNKPLTPAQRFKKKQAGKGLRQVHLWVHVSNPHEHIKAIERELQKPYVEPKQRS